MKEEADTVGCCSLRCSHLSFPDGHSVTFDFLGKDSMRYCNTVDRRRGRARLAAGPPRKRA